MQKLKIKQGTVLPTTGIGIGYLILFIYCLMLYRFGMSYMLRIPAAYILPFIFTVMQFTYKDFIIEDLTDGYKISFRYFFIPIGSIRHRWNDYSLFVLRVLNTQYKALRGGTGGMLATNYSEKKIAIVGRDKKSKESVLICSGNKTQLDEIIKKYMIPFDAKIYLGAPKKGYEYVPK